MHASDNGGNPSGICAQHDVAIMSLEDRADDHDRAIGRVLAAASSADQSARATHLVATSLAESLASFATRVDQRFDTLERRVAEEQIARVQSACDWDINEPTLTGAEPEQDARRWKTRAGIAEVRVENAELRVRRWRITAGVITAVLVAAFAAAQVIVPALFGGG